MENDAVITTCIFDCILLLTSLHHSSYPEVKSAMERVADLRLEKLRALELQNKNVKRKHSMIVTIANFDAKQMRKIQEKTERYSVKKTQDGALAVPGIGEAGDGAKPSTASSGGGRMSKKGSKKKHLIRRISAANMEEDDEEDYQPMKEMLQPTIQRRKSDVYSFAKEEPLKYFSGDSPNRRASIAVLTRSGRGQLGSD